MSRSIKLAKKTLSIGERTARVASVSSVIVSLIISGVADFTTMSETLPPQQLMEVLSAYLNGMAEIVMNNGGMVDKYVGDAVMAIFGAPLARADHAQCALRCAQAMEIYSREFSVAQLKLGIAFGLTRIGVHSGPAVVGNIGGSNRFDYTVLGDTVNIAARLEQANKQFGTSILISETTAVTARSDQVLLPIGEIFVKGRLNTVKVFAIPNPELCNDDFVNRYINAFDCLQNDKCNAIILFEALEYKMPHLPLVQYQLERARASDCVEK